jgi:hypothetical protein
MHQIINFIKYNNAVPIALAVIILGTGAAFAASPTFREAVLAPAPSVPQPIVPAKPTDASRLLALNLETYDIAVRIDKLSETADAYLVDYSYASYDVVAGAWQETRKAKHMDIPKALLGKRSLTDYLSEQLGQVTHREIAYLGEAQIAAAGEADAKKGSTKYAALVGKELRTGDGTPSYAGTGVKDAKNGSGSGASGSGVKSERATSPAAAAISDEKLREMIVAAVSDFLAIDTSMPAVAPAEPAVADTPAVVPSEEAPTEEAAETAEETETPVETPAEETSTEDGQETVAP